MIKFVKMSSGNVLYGPKSAKLSSFDKDRLSAPYDGEVVNTHNKQCNNGYMLIRHNINNEVYYSQFCGVGLVILSFGDYVKAGKTIGYFSTDDITYSFLNSNLKAIDPEKPFKEGFKSDKSKEEKKNKENKGENTIDSSSNDRIGLVSLALKPIDILSKQTVKQGSKLAKNLKNIGKSMFQLHDKEKDEKLNEDIERIKKLLK